MKEKQKILIENLMMKHKMLFAEAKDGILTNLKTNQKIPTEHIIYQKAPKDGVFLLHECTCDGSLGAEMKKTPENIKEYQCQIGRRAPLCDSYIETKCAVYSLEEIGKLTIRINFNDLIAIFD